MPVFNLQRLGLENGNWLIFFLVTEIYLFLFASVSWYNRMESLWGSIYLGIFVQGGSGGGGSSGNGTAHDVRLGGQKNLNQITWREKLEDEWGNSQAHEVGIDTHGKVLESTQTW